MLLLHANTAIFGSAALPTAGGWFGQWHGQYRCREDVMRLPVGGLPD
jgi:hypothetical protein